MSKEQALEILMLLSAIESWSYRNRDDFPVYLIEQLDKTVGELKAKLLGVGDE